MSILFSGVWIAPFKYFDMEKQPFKQNFFLKFFCYIYLFCVRVFVCVCARTYAYMHVWREEDNLLNSVLFFHHVDLSSRTQMVRLDSKCLCLLSHHSGPKQVFLYCCFWVLRWCFLMFVGNIFIEMNIFYFLKPMRTHPHPPTNTNERWFYMNGKSG